MSFDLILKIHLIAVAFWFGLLAAELIVERTRTQSISHSRAVAHQHFWIDMLFETPAFLTVLLTGILMLDLDRENLFYWVKIFLGFVAVAGNILCTIAITRRKFASDHNHRPGVIKHSKFVDRVSAIAVPAGVIATLIAVLIL